MKEIHYIVLYAQGEGAVLPYMGYTGMCGHKGYGFSAVLVINREWFLYSSPDMGMFLNLDATFPLLSKRKSQHEIHNLRIFNSCVKNRKYKASSLRTSSAFRKDA